MGRKVQNISKKVMKTQNSPIFFMSVLPILLFGKSEKMGCFQNKGTIGREINLI